MTKKERKTYPPGYYSCFGSKRLCFFNIGIPASRAEMTIYSSGFNSSRKWLASEVRTLNWTVYYNFSPGASFEIKNKSIELTPDKLIFMPGNCSFKRTSNDNFIEHLWISFFYSHNIAPEQDIPIVIQINDTLCCLLRDLRALLENSEIDSDKCYHCSQALIYTVMVMPEINWSAPMPDVLIKVLGLIKNNIRDKLTTQKLVDYPFRQFLINYIRLEAKFHNSSDL